MVVHLVLFNPKPGLTSDGIRLFAQSIQATLREVPGIERALIGKSIHLVPEYARLMGDMTYEYAAVLEFADADRLKTYLNDPAHRQLGRLFWDYCGSAIVTEAEMWDVLRSDLPDLV